MLKDKCNDTTAEASALIEQLSQFLVLLEIWSEVLCDINSLSVYLQNDSMDLVTASKMIDTAMNVLKEQRSSNHFDNLLTKA